MYGEIKSGNAPILFETFNSAMGTLKKKGYTKMQFFAVNGKRPVRLSEQTRQFAFESLNHRYGKETCATPAVAMDDVEGFAAMTELEKYDAGIERIVMEAPLRICEGEKVSGAATLGNAIYHRVPITYKGKAVFSSVSHLTIDFETVLKKGISFIRKTA